MSPERFTLLVASSAIAVLVAAGVTLRSPAPITVQGNANVIDGDTIIIGGGAHVRLWGIDAEETYEPHGNLARTALWDYLFQDPRVTCTVMGSSYERVVALCKDSFGRDIGEAMVRKGYVLDCPRYSGGWYSHFEPRGIRSKLISKGYC